MGGQSNRKITLFMFGFLGFWTLLTGLFDGFLGYNLYRQIRADSFPATRGQVVDTDIERHDGGDDPDTYKAVIRFHYSVNGRAYEADTWRYGAWGSSDRGEARAVVKRFAKGKQVDVHYDPADPSSAVLVTGVQGFDLFMGLFMMPFNAVMLGGWYVLIRELLRHVLGMNQPKPRPTYNGCRVRLARISPVITGLFAAGVTGFACIFIIAFIVGYDGKVVMLQRILIGIVALGVAAFFVKLIYNLLNPQYVSIDTQQGTLSLPLPKHREPIPIERIIDVRTEIAYNDSESSGDGYYIFKPTITYLDAADDEQKAQLPAMVTERVADQLTGWLRRQVGLAER